MAIIKVRVISTGQLGTLDDSEFDPQVFSVVQEEAQPQQTTQSSGLIESLGAGVVGVGKALASPFVQTGRRTGAAIYEVGRGLSSLMGNKNAYVNQETGETVQNPIMSEQELATASLNPLDKNSMMRKQIGDSAQVASYAIPFGKGAGFLTKATLPGVAVGLTQEAGRELANSEDLNAKKIVGSGAIGGLSSTALYGLGKGVEAIKNKPKNDNLLQKAGQDLRQDVRHIRVKPSIYGASQEKRINQTLSDLGISGSPQQQYEQLLPKMQDLTSKVDDALANNPGSVDTKIVVDSFYGKLKGTLRTSDLSKKQIQDTINGYVADLYGSISEKQLGSTITNQELHQLKQVAFDDYSRAFLKQSMGQALTPKETVAMDAWKVIDAQLNKLNPEVTKLTRMQSDLFKAAPSLSGARNTVPTLRVAGTSLPAGVLSGGKDLGGRMLGATGNAVQGAGNASGGILGLLGSTNTIPKVGATPVGLSTNVLTSMLGNQPANNPQNEQQPINGYPNNEDKRQDTQSQVNQIASKDQVTPKQNIPQYVTGYSPENLANARSMAIMAGDTANANKLDEMYKIEINEQKRLSQTSGKSMSAAQMQVQGKARSGVDAANLIEEMLTKNPSLSTRAAIPMLDLLKGQDRKLYESAISSITDAIGGLRTGATVSPAQQVFYANMLPKSGDSPATIKAKLDAVRAELNGYLNVNLTDLAEPSGITSLLGMQ